MSGQHDPIADRSSWTDLSAYTPGDFTPGRGKLTQIAWFYCSLLFVESGWLPMSCCKRWLLRLFGARVGCGVVIKPGVRIKFPWRLTIGDYTWIGQDVWIDNLADVEIGAHACLSQGAYLCTGSHNARSPNFELQTDSIRIGDGAWVAARSLVLPGVELAANSMAAAGSVVTKSVAEGVMVGGNPAKPIADRRPS